MQFVAGPGTRLYCNDNESLYRVPVQSVQLTVSTQPARARYSEVSLKVSAEELGCTRHTPLMLLRHLELSRHSLGSCCFTPRLRAFSCEPYTYVAVIEVSVSMSQAPFPAARFPSVVAMCSAIVTAV